MSPPNHKKTTSSIATYILQSKKVGNKKIDGSLLGWVKNLRPILDSDNYNLCYSSVLTVYLG